MGMVPKSASAGRKSSKSGWPVAAVLIALIITGGVVFGVKSCVKAPSDALHAAGEEAAKVASNFFKGNITTAFVESLPELSSDPGGRLELASFRSVESFSTSNNLTIWGYLDLGSTVTEIKVPAIYRYYLRLHDPWQLDISTNICIVHAPRFHPTLPVAIDTSRLEKKSSAGWARFNAGEQMDQLEKDLTPTLSVYAADARHVALVREECRKTVAQFVRDWLLKEQQWQDGRFTAVKVVFPDETNFLTMPSSLELKTN